ncbi:MAG: hypothetical protein WCJ21_07000, partial [Planctomycetota bacterium]
MQPTLVPRHWRITLTPASFRRLTVLLLIGLLCGEAIRPTSGWGAEPVAPALARSWDQTRFEVTTFAKGLAYPT